MKEAGRGRVSHGRRDRGGYLQQRWWQAAHLEAAVNRVSHHVRVCGSYDWRRFSADQQQQQLQNLLDQGHCSAPEQAPLMSGHLAQIGENLYKSGTGTSIHSLFGQ